MSLSVLLCYIFFDEHILRSVDWNEYFTTFDDVCTRMCVIETEAPYAELKNDLSI